MIVETKGIVLKESHIKDYDKRLVIYTKDYGKIVCFSKNAKKKNTAVSSLLSYSDLKLFKGSSTYTLIEGELIESFEALKKDILKLSYGMYFLEFIDYVGKEELINTDLLKLVLYSLKGLTNDKLNHLVVARVFELKILQILGLMPNTDSCLVCKNKDTIYFSPSEGSVICEKEHDIKDLIYLDRSSVNILEYIFSTPVNSIFSFNIKNKELIQIEQLTTNYVKIHIDHRFKTLDFIRTIS